MKKIAFITFLLLSAVLVSCKKDNNDDNNNGKTEFVHDNKYNLTISASSLSVNLFDLNEFKLGAVGLNNASMSFAVELMTYFDSISWKLPGILNYVGTKHSMMTGMSQSFYKPGKYTMVVKGYVGNKVVTADSVSVNVFMEGDFLSLKWDKPKDDFFNYIDEANNIYLNFKYVEKVNPYAWLDYGPNRPSSNNEVWKQETAEGLPFLRNYINTIYGKAVLQYDGEDLTQTNLIEEYNKRFKNSLNDIIYPGNKYPLIIWDTPNTHIALIAIIEKSDKGITYKIVAEPNKNDAQ